MYKEENCTPYWAKLLLAWEQHGGAGLTLPFLTGARTIYNNGVHPSSEDARSLLEEIFATGIKGRTIGIDWSGITKAYGICLIKGKPSGGVYLPTPASVFSIDLACEEFGSQPEEIIEGLATLYAREISAQTYSITSGKWRAFDDADKDFIRKALCDRDVPDLSAGFSK